MKRKEEGATYPFSFPIVLVGDGGTVVVRREAMISFPKGKVGFDFRVFSREGLFRPLRLMAIHPTGRRLFGSDLVDVDFEWSTGEWYDLRRLADDDIHAQLRSHEEHLAAIDAAANFIDLVDAMAPA